MLRRIVSSLTPAKVRRKIIPWSALFLLALILPLAACAGATSAPPSGDGTTPTPLPTPTPISSASVAIQVDELAIDPPVAEPGEGIIITAQVTNAGVAEGSYTAELRINDIAEEVKKVTIPAGKTYTLRFSGARTAPGTYDVSLGELAGQFVIVEQTKLLQVDDFQTSEAESDVPGCCGGDSDSVESEPDTSGGCGCGCSGGCGGS